MLFRSEGKGKKQIQIRFDYEQMARLGLSPAQVASTIRMAYDGEIVTNLRRKGEEVDYRVMIKEDHQTSLELIKTLTVKNQTNQLIPLNRLIQIEELKDKLIVNHYDGDRSLTIYGEVDTAKNTSVKINKEIRDTFMPMLEKFPGTRIVFGGEEKDTQEAMQSLLIAMMMALLGIYFILVIFKNHLY